MHLAGETLSHLVQTYGYLGVLGLIALESSGLPLPGETALVTAAIYAGTTQHLDIRLLIAAAAGGAISATIWGSWSVASSAFVPCCGMDNIWASANHG